MSRKNNTLKSEIQIFHKAGFIGGTKNSYTRNPVLILENGVTLVGLAGQLVGLVTTETFFGTGQHLKNWKSNSKNDSCATMTTTQLKPDASGTCTQIYYREARRTLIKDMARAYNCEEKAIYGDHINHMRGDCRDENIEFGTARQNNLNRKPNNKGAFLTLAEVEQLIANGTFVPRKLDTN